ncbi:DUF2339 domain-containing protein [Rhizobium sp. CSW-27]|uniref:DUF2339 domain-containing protein n=1 Tax=Rhizobium sp. CSW-27 TaxID=2839985 RepID=UPI001C030D99|nr:DUF2339 domain-containing protein [Rhizobium sp. CSW-27]MBT9368516.1 DUF2339 domain-containing protein [Rhizobium sp. CSW-27]
MLELILIALLFALLFWQLQLSQRLRTLENEVKALKKTLAPFLSIPAPAAPEPVIQTPIETAKALPSADIKTAAPQSMEPKPQKAPLPAASLPKPAPKPTPKPTPKPISHKPGESFESRLGARWTVWVGGLALALGGVFLVRYSIESGLLGPGTRLVLAVLFGLLLAGAGEILRRRALPNLPAIYTNAMVPGMLTAAASVTLLASLYTAHASYGFIGTTHVFLLLALVSLSTIALSLLHGQALAGLGLIGSLITPALVTSDAPNIGALFGFLSLVWLASNGAARIRRWLLVPALANLGLLVWVVAYSVNADVVDSVPPGLSLLVMLASTALLWPGRAFEDTGEAPRTPAGALRHLFGLLGRRPRRIMISASLAAMLSALTLLLVDAPARTHPVLIFVAVTGLLAGLGAGRRAGAWPALLASTAAIWGVGLTALFGVSDLSPTPAETQGLLAAMGPDVLGALVLGAIFTACGLLFLRRKGQNDPDMAMLWAILAAAVPVTLASITFLNYGTFGRDWLHGTYALAIGAALRFVAFRLAKADEDPATPNLVRDLLLIGSFAAFTFSLHALTHGLATTIGVSLLGFAYVALTRSRPWRGLPWVMVAATLVLFFRIGWDPTIVGPDRLGKTPFFNALLPGYGIPAVLLIASAWLLRHWPGRRVLNALQGLAALMGLLTLAILVRHAMSGGVLDDRALTLGEQSIYTLLTVGLSGVLMTLDLKSPSPVFRHGSILAGVIATINVLVLHLGKLNPYFSGELIGNWPILNLLLPGYLLPAFAYAGLALYARNKRPGPYMILLALTAALLGFAWATLSVRGVWQGSNIADWKGFLEGETYTYSVVWLAIGVGLLALGSRLDARSLRLASAGLVLISVCKVFLIDMANLEGILRALSFIGLGGVLIGIGLFYQRILARSNEAAPPAGD